MTYEIHHFIQNAHPAPQHLEDIATASSGQVAVNFEQPVFKKQERGKLLPLERRRISDPTKWKKNLRAFDRSWGTKDPSQDIHRVPKCTKPKCNLGCAKLSKDDVIYARDCFETFANLGGHEKNAWLYCMIRPLPCTLEDHKIWTNYVSKHRKPDRKHWQCTYCKCHALTSDLSTVDTKHRFKPAGGRRSKFAPCPNYAEGLELKEAIVATTRATSKFHAYFVPLSNGREYQVHLDVFRSIFNIGQRIIYRCQNWKSKLIDKRSTSSGRTAHHKLRVKVEHFWLKEVDTEPSHYSSTSTKQRVIDVTSVAHGWLVFLGRHFPEKYQECVDKHFFPGLHKRAPEQLQHEDVPIIACKACITRASTLNLSQIVCSHIPKFTFFQAVTRTFNIGFKRPGTDQCEQCNTLHRRIQMARALGRHDRADQMEESMLQHREKLSQYQVKLLDHHLRAASFRSVMGELQHTSKHGSGSTLPRYAYDPEVEWASRDIIQSISMDAGSGLRTPFCRVGFAYFSRVLVTNVYHIVDHGATDRQSDFVYLWNELCGGKGPDECLSMFMDFIQAGRSGAKRLVVEIDGCNGQIWNQYFFALSASLVDPSSDICRALGAKTGRPIFERIDAFRGELGYTFMAPDRKHGVIRRECRKKDHIATIQEYEEIIRKCNQGRFRVKLIQSGDGFFVDMKKYLDQSFKLGGSQTDIDGKQIATRARHWANFGLGPSGGPDSKTTVHKYGAWRLREGYDPAERPCEIVVGRHTRPVRSKGEYVCVKRTLGEYERSRAGFIRYGSPSLHDKWRHDRPLKPEKVRDTHKLACLGLPENKIKFWPCPDRSNCVLERCPFRVHKIDEDV